MVCHFCKAAVKEGDNICKACGNDPFLTDIKQSFTNRLYEKTPYSRTILPYVIFAAIMSPLLVFYAIFTYAFGNSPNTLMSGYMILIIISVAAAVAGGIVMQVRHHQKLKEKDVHIAQGKIVDFQQHTGVGQRFYSIVEFKVNDKKYRYVDNRDSDHAPRIGKKFDIAYHSHNPHDCFRAKDNRGIVLIVTVLAVVAVVGAVYFAIHNSLLNF